MLTLRDAGRHRRWRRVIGVDTRSVEAAADGLEPERARFMATLGMVTTAFFIVHDDRDGRAEMGAPQCL